MTFQAQVNMQPAPAVAGDFASANPRATALAGPGQIVAGASGVTVGTFVWVASGVAANAGAGVPSGFVHREVNALITAFLAETSNVIPAGLPMSVYTQGDFWVSTGTVATIGQKVFASNTTGQIQTAAAGATVAGYTETKWFVASAGAVGELIKMTTWG